MPSSQREPDLLRLIAAGSLEDPPIAYRPVLVNEEAISLSTVATVTSSSSPDASPQSLGPNTAELLNEDDSCKITKQQDLWDRAFDSLRVRDKKLVARYDRYLRREVAGVSLGQSSGAQKEKQLQAYIRDKLALHEKSGKMRDLGRQALEIVLFGKAFISAVVSTDPHASLAWTGVCLLLPVSDCRKFQQEYH